MTATTTTQIVPTLNGDDTGLYQNLLATGQKNDCKVEVFAPGEEQGGSVLGEGDCLVVHGFLDKEGADAFFQKLDDSEGGGEIAYQQWYHMPDAKKEAKGRIDIPLRPLTRIKVAQTSPPDSEGKIPHYRFPVNNQSVYGTTVFTPTVQKIRDQVQQFLDSRRSGESRSAKEVAVALNHAVVLLYRNGEDRIGLHKDKLLDLDEAAPICSVSLGQQRVYVLQDSVHTPTRRQEITLTHGALLVLGPKTNEHWYHSIRGMTEKEVEEQPAAKHHRVSVTLRAVKTYLNPTTNELSGKGATYDTMDWPEELRGAHRR